MDRRSWQAGAPGQLGQSEVPAALKFVEDVCHPVDDCRGRVVIFSHETSVDQSINQYGRTVSASPFPSEENLTNS